MMDSRKDSAKTINNIMEGTTKLRYDLTDIITNIEISDNTTIINSVITQIERNKNDIDAELDKIELIEMIRNLCLDPELGKLKARAGYGINHSGIGNTGIWSHHPKNAQRWAANPAIR